MGFFSSLFSSEPDLENFSPDQMNRYVESLDKWINKHIDQLNLSDSVRVELQNKRALRSKAMAVWKRKIEEAQGCK